MTRFDGSKLVMAVLIASSLGCGDKKSNEGSGRSSQPASLDGKHISDDEFLCTLPEDYSLVAEETTYTGEIAALLETKCVACHKAGATAPDLSSYDAAQGAADVSLEAIQGGSMPPGSPLAAADKALFKAWVDGGLLESPAAPTPSPSKPKPKPSSGDDVSEFCDAQGYDQEGAK